ncbi:MAG: metaphase chromosome protein 1, partial [Leuconostoc mesenteroides]
IMRTVMAINFFKWQGKDVAEMMKTSNAIDELQFKFLSESEDDDDFNLEIINETFRGLSPKMKPLKNTDDVQKLQPSLSRDEMQTEIEFADKSLQKFQEASVKDVVSDNVINMLHAFHEGMAREFNATHNLWRANLLNAFAEKYLLDYWTPQWRDLDGIGGEVKSYLTFLSSKKALTGLGDLVAGTLDIDRYIDVIAINSLLEKLDMKDIEKLS